MNWISVKDRLPEPAKVIGGTEFSADVLVWDGDEIAVDVMMYPHGLYGHDTTPRFSSNGYGSKEGITHWMPLPEPPEGKA